MKMAINIKLKPKSSLLNCNFDGYKLNPVDNQTTIVKEIEHGIFRNGTEDATCYLYTRMESLHNHIFSDILDENSVYVFNKKGHLLMLSLVDNYITPAVVVWQEDLQVAKETTDSGFKHWFSPSISFPSSNMAISSNGRGQLNILLTGDRNGAGSWVSLKTLNVAPASVVHSICIEKSNDSKYQQEIHCLLLSVTTISELKRDSSHSNVNQFNEQKSSLHILYWFNFGFDGAEWEVARERRIVGSNGLEFVCLDPKGEGVILLCHSNYAFVYDSLTPVQEAAAKQGIQEKSNRKYAFIQNNEEIKIWVNAGRDILKADLKIEVQNQNLKICIKDSLLLDKKFLNAVESSATTWSIDKDKIEICVPKSQENVCWSRLFEECDVEGEEILDEAHLEEIHQRLSHLTSEEWNPNPEPDHPAYDPGQLEACDAASEDISLLILNGKTHFVSHSSHLGAVQHLLNVNCGGSSIPCFCLRHDVDGVLWEPKEDHSFEHVATFDAFGYVKASKSMAKFTRGAPDNSYVAIADVNSHVYVFCQSEFFGGELRNRTSGQMKTKIARQLVISLPNHDQVMGFYAASKSIFVLTDTDLFVYVL